MQMKLVLEDHGKIYFLARSQSPVCVYQNSPDLRAIVIPIFILSPQNVKNC